MKREPTWSEYYNAKQMQTGFAFQQPCLTFQALTLYPRAAQHSCNISLLHSEAAFEQIGIAAGPCCVYQHTSFPCQAFEFMVLGENKEEGDCMCCWKPGRLIESRNGGLPIQIPSHTPSGLIRWLVVDIPKQGQRRSSRAACQWGRVCSRLTVAPLANLLNFPACVSRSRFQMCHHKYEPHAQYYVNARFLPEALMPAADKASTVAAVKSSPVQGPCHNGSQGNDNHWGDPASWNGPHKAPCPI